MFIYCNGEIVQKEDARISPFDHGFLYGLGVFETFRTYHRQPFLFDEHWDRLQLGVKELNIHLSLEKYDVLDALQTLSNKNNLEHSRIRLNVSAGEGEGGLQTEAFNNPTVLIIQSPITNQSGIQEKTGKVLKTRRNTPEGEFRLKSHHFLNNVLAKREVGNDPSVEGIFLTKEGYVAEGVTSNVFWIRDDILYTPDIQTGILKGITRQFVIDLARNMNLPAVEGIFTIDDLLQADEVFCTNSVQEIMPITRIEDRKVLIGDITKSLINLYHIHTNKLVN